MFFKLNRILFFGINVLLFLSCATSLRVYRPYPLEKPFELVTANPSVTVITPDSNSKTFAFYDPFIFRLRGNAKVGGGFDLENEYGSLNYLIRKEISIRAENYPLLQKEGGRIEIKSYSLESVDYCLSNVVSVHLIAEVQLGSAKSKIFEYKDETKSFVSDCYLLGSSLTLLPLLWYVPYNGFRGNREDQMNQTGRNSLEAFFTFLETQSGYSPKSNIEKIPSPPPDPVRDPKVKEIMENL